MALQAECDCCHEFWHIESLIWIKRYEQVLCSECINEIIDSLEEKQ